MIRTIRSLSCSRVLQIRSILRPKSLAVQKFRSIESFVNYRANAQTNFQESCLQCLRPLRNPFEINFLTVLKPPHQLNTYISEKTEEPKNFVQCRKIKETSVMNCSQNSASLSIKSDSNPPDCPPCEPCPNKFTEPPPTTSANKPSKGGRLIAGLFLLVAKFFIAAGIVQFSDAIGVWDNPTSWELMQIKWKKFVNDIEGIVIENSSFGYTNRKK